MGSIMLNRQIPQPAQPPQQNRYQQIMDVLAAARSGDPQAMVMAKLQQNPQLAMQLQQLQAQYPGASMRDIANNLLMQNGLDPRILG